MKPAEKKKKGQLVSEEVEAKLDDFYDSFDVDEKLEGSEDVHRLIEENEELLRKVDTLVDVLLRAAKELGDEKEQQEVLQQIAKELEALRDLKEKLEDYSSSLADAVPEIRRISERVDSIADLVRKVDKLGSIDELYQKNREVCEQITSLSSSIESILDQQTEGVREKLVEIYKQLESIEELKEKIDTLREALYSLVESDAKITSELEEGLKLVNGLSADLQNISSRVDELRASLSEAESKLQEVEGLRSRLDAIVLAMGKIPERVNATIEEHSHRIESKLDSIPSELKELEKHISNLDGLKKEISELKELVRSLNDDEHRWVESKLRELTTSLPSKISEDLKKSNSQIATRIEELERRVADINSLKKEISEIKEILKASRDEERHWIEHKFEVLEKEVESLSLAVEAVQKTLSGSVDERKKAIDAITRRTEGIIEMLHQLRTVSSKEEEERLRKLQESLRSMFLSISEAISKISEQEKKEFEIFNDYVRHIEERMGRLEKMLEEDATPSTIQEVRGELSDISKKLAALADLVHVNTSLLKVRSGDVAELIARFRALDEKLSRMEDEVSKAPTVLTNLQKDIEKELEKLRVLVIKGIRELRIRRDSDVIKEYKELKDAISVIHAELKGVLEVLKKYDVTANLREISQRLEEIRKAVDKDNADRSAISRELADIEEQLARISSAVSEADVRAVKSRLDEIYRAVDAISKRIKNAKAVLGEEELREVIKSLELLQEHIRKLRAAGLGEELSEMHGRVKDLHSTLRSEIEAVKEGKAHHATVAAHHSELKKLVAPVVEVSDAVGSVAAAKESAAKQIKKAATDLAKKGGSTHAHIIASYSDRLVRTAKAMKDVERLVKKIQKKVENMDKELGSKRGGETKKKLSDIVNRDVDAVFVAKLAKVIDRMRKGEVRTSKDLAKDLGVSEEVVKRALDKISSTGDVEVRVRKPSIPLSGGSYIVTKL